MPPFRQTPALFITNLKALFRRHAFLPSDRPFPDKSQKVLSSLSVFSTIGCVLHLPIYFPTRLGSSDDVHGQSTDYTYIQYPWEYLEKHGIEIPCEKCSHEKSG